MITAAISPIIRHEKPICESTSSSETIYLIAPAAVPSVFITDSVIAIIFSLVLSFPTQVAFPEAEFIASIKSGIFC